MYITTNPVNQELFKNFEAARIWSNNIVATKDAKDIVDISSTKKEIKKEKLNLPVLCATTIGTLASVLFIRKYQGMSIKNDLMKLSRSNDIKTNFKNITNFFDINPKLKEMLILSTGSILGGLAGGIITDKENTKNKVKEGVYQFTNVAVPASLVTGLLNLVEKSKISNPRTTQIAKIGAVVTGIGGGMAISTRLSNKINNSIVDNNAQSKRSIKLKDGIMQIDDASIALILGWPKLAAKLCVDKIVPLLFLTCGYEAGKQK
ncbi:MAG: hypothetical protein A2104_08945 [Candidatus Melainabacteria bacterium GWF2_32_7]|nr:MAG: hypothetical protein A2104_08945 [Candidatus Melainabacteria bacterium GWF2_32_7]